MNEKYVDHAGEVYHFLTALEPTGRKSETEGDIWFWLCECGKIIEAPYRAVKKGNVKSCGCSRHTVKPGEKYNRLTVIRATEERNRKMVVFEFRCECGNIVRKPGYLVKKGDIKSCGCLEAECKRDGFKRFKKNFVCGTNLGKIRQSEYDLQKNNTTGAKGVTFDPKRGRYESRIYFRGRAYYVYCYNRDEALRHRRNLRVIHDSFIEWWDSLSPEDQEKVCKKYNSIKEAQRNLFKERVDAYRELIKAEKEKEEAADEKADKQE